MSGIRVIARSSHATLMQYQVEIAMLSKVTAASSGHTSRYWLSRETNDNIPPS